MDERSNTNAGEASFSDKVFVAFSVFAFLGVLIVHFATFFTGAHLPEPGPLGALFVLFGFILFGSMILRVLLAVAHGKPNKHAKRRRLSTWVRLYIAVLFIYVFAAFGGSVLTVTNDFPKLDANGGYLVTNRGIVRSSTPEEHLLLRRLHVRLVTIPFLAIFGLMVVFAFHFKKVRTEPVA